MRINHNIAALNTYRQLNSASGAQSKSMEKLSSGLRINKAGDDAAGLAISEKMRGQIRGLDMAAKNAQDGVSMLQTAEGALNETHSILQRMRELSVQSSNDTNTDADRESINTEINQLKEEIDRIGNTTEFNTKKLIDGSIGEKKIAGTDNAAVVSEALGKQTKATTGALAVAFNGGTAKIANIDADVSSSIKVDGADINFTIKQADIQGATNIDDFAKLSQDTINAAIDKYNSDFGTDVAHITVAKDATAPTKLVFTSGSEGGDSTIDITADAETGKNQYWEIAGIAPATGSPTTSVTGSEGIFDAAGAAKLGAVDAADTSKVTIDGVELEVTWASVGGASATAGTTTLESLSDEFAKDINDTIDDYNATVPSDKQIKNVTVGVKDGSFVVTSGSDKATSSIKFDDSEAAQLLGVAKQNSATQGGGVDFQIGANQTQKMKVTIEDMRTDALGIKDIDLSNKAGAEEAITKINDAIEKVSTQRSNLGAFQNRLEHTINNLGTSSENLTAAESRVRDVDMAKEMMEQTKNSILSQAAQAMLAQSNQMPQGVLQLLR
ncbi:flagellin N-terminal helical domain-containing protein [Niallia sp. Sow4_A1]|uniref:flagellin N-terminal helical domain-containing protein n=1 Tax=Niallia sp. Sow4_A1 TaxID=3438793 RepID=UPI003F99E85C